MACAGKFFRQVLESLVRLFRRINLLYPLLIDFFLYRDTQSSIYCASRVRKGRSHCRHSNGEGKGEEKEDKRKRKKRR